jgi:hypothetical protein
MYTSQIKRFASPLFVVVALAFTGTALAGMRPDDRGSVRGVGTTSRILPVRPDDRSAVRGAGAIEFAGAVRPDNRAGIRGIGYTSGGGFTTSAYGAPPEISSAPPTSGIVKQRTS